MLSLVAFCMTLGKAVCWCCIWVLSDSMFVGALSTEYELRSRCHQLHLTNTCVVVYDLVCLWLEQAMLFGKSNITSCCLVCQVYYYTSFLIICVGLYSHMFIWYGTTPPPIPTFFNISGPLCFWGRADTYHKQHVTHRFQWLYMHKHDADNITSTILRMQVDASLQDGRL